MWGERSIGRGEGGGRGCINTPKDQISISKSLSSRFQVASKSLSLWDKGGIVVFGGRERGETEI